VPPKELHEARLLQDAELADPGIVRRFRSTMHSRLSKPDLFVPLLFGAVDLDPKHRETQL
jgi:hypothetical protein